ncbi:unnamed protein product, partial [Polarella glacialis]
AHGSCQRSLSAGLVRSTSSQMRELSGNRTAATNVQLQRQPMLNAVWPPQQLSRSMGEPGSGSVTPGAPGTLRATSPPPTTQGTSTGSMLDTSRLPRNSNTWPPRPLSPSVGPTSQPVTQRSYVPPQVDFSDTLSADTLFQSLQLQHQQHDHGQLQQSLQQQLEQLYQLQQQLPIP